MSGWGTAIGYAIEALGVGLTAYNTFFNTPDISSPDFSSAGYNDYKQQEAAALNAITGLKSQNDAFQAQMNSQLNQWASTIDYLNKQSQTQLSGLQSQLADMMKASQDSIAALSGQIQSNLDASQKQIADLQKQLQQDKQLTADEKAKLDTQIQAQQAVVDQARAVTQQSLDLYKQGQLTQAYQGQYDQLYNDQKKKVMESLASLGFDQNSTQYQSAMQGLAQWAAALKSSMLQGQLTNALQVGGFSDKQIAALQQEWTSQAGISNAQEGQAANLAQLLGNINNAAMSNLVNLQKVSSADMQAYASQLVNLYGLSQNQANQYVNELMNMGKLEMGLNQQNDTLGLGIADIYSKMGYGDIDWAKLGLDQQKINMDAAYHSGQNFANFATNLTNWGGKMSDWGNWGGGGGSSSGSDGGSGFNWNPDTSGGDWVTNNWNNS